MAKIVNILFLAFVALAYLSVVAFAQEEGKKKVVEVVEGAGAAAGGSEVKKIRPPRSLLQACRKEINKVCPEKKAIVKCLSSKVNEIEEGECKTWVLARDACTTAATKSDKCTPKDSPRQCLRKVNASELPESCTNSDFYKSVKMFSMFRKNPGKSGLLGKIGQK